MPAFTLTLFGPPRIKCDGQLVHLNRRKAIALLAYLATTGRAYSRDTLSSLFWPEYSQRNARTYLRQALHSLSSTLTREMFAVERDMIELATGCPLSSDVGSFVELQKNVQLASNDASLSCQWSQAVDLYQDDFMASFSLNDAPAYDEWQAYEREGFRRQAVAMLAALTDKHQRSGQIVDAIGYARRWLVLDPLIESAHRSLMLLYAKNGEMAAALQQYAAYADLLAEELDTVPSAEITNLYARIKADRLSDIPSDQDRSMASHHALRYRSMAFVGRERELSLTVQRVTDPACRLLTLIGPGGIGKSRLALEVVGAAGSHFQDGVYFVPLAAIRTAPQIAPAILSALDISRQDNVNSDDQLLRVLQFKHMLLILDNYEQLLPETRLLATLIEEAPGVKLIVTSRVRLDLSTEWLLQLDGLDLPAFGTEDNLIQVASVRFFIQAAQRVQPAFALTTANSDAVAQLCRQLNGNPLALNLAAGWIRAMPPALILRKVRRGLQLLQTDARHVPRRHRSMTVVFDHSWQLLPLNAQNALWGLTVFGDSFTDEAAQAVGNASPLELLELVDRSWVTFLPVGRFRLHELVRLYMAERLEADRHEAWYQVRKATQRRHAQYYCRQMEQLQRLLKGEDQVAGLRWIRAESDNIWTAWRWAATFGETAYLQQAGFSLWYAADTLGWNQEAVDAFAAALVTLRDKLSAPSPSTVAESDSAATISELLAYQAILHVRRGLPELARQNVKEALALLVEQPVDAQQRHVYAVVKLIEGWVLHDLAQYEAAIDSLLPARAAFQSQQSAWWLGQAELILGLATHDLGRHAAAKEHFVAANQIWQVLGEQRFRSYALGRLAQLAREAGDIDTAIHFLSIVLQTRQALGDRVGLSYALSFMGDTALAAGDLTDAKMHYRKAETLALELDNHHVLLSAQQGLGRVAMTENKVAEADVAFRNAYATAHEAQRPLQMAVALLDHSAVAIDRERLTEAQDYLVKALRLSANLNAESLTLEICYHFAQLCLLRKKIEHAVKLLALVQSHTSATPQLRRDATKYLTEMDLTIEREIEPESLHQVVGDILRSLAV